MSEEMKTMEAAAAATVDTKEAEMPVLILPGEEETQLDQMMVEASAQPETVKEVNIEDKIQLTDAEKKAVEDFAGKIDISNATDTIAMYEEIMDATEGKLADVVINVVNIPNTEMSSIIACKDGGLVYFFSMATSFTKAALGAEGIGKDVTMLVGNGYTKGHSEVALQVLREDERIRNLFAQLYA